MSVLRFNTSRRLERALDLQPAAAVTPQSTDGLAAARPRAPRWPWALGVPVVMLVATAGLLLGLSIASASSPVPPGTRVVVDATVEQAWQAVLDDRARAVRDRDEAAFLLTIDTGDQAFVTAQRQLFANLELLPLKVWRYRLLHDKDFDLPDPGYGAPYGVNEVELDYQLRGFDRAPIARPAGITFVNRSGTWLIGGDSAVDDRLPPGANAEPWDVGPIDVIQSGNSLVITARGDDSVAQTLADDAESSVDSVSAMWRHRWSQKVVVIALNSQSVWQSYFREQSDPADFVALAVPVTNRVKGWDYRQPGRWSGTRVIVSPVGLALAGEEYSASTIEHEITHVATMSYTGNGAEQWLVEGAAEYTGMRLHPLPAGYYLQSSRELDKEGIPSTATFYVGDVQAHYDSAWLLCSYLVDVGGEHRFAEFYREAVDVQNSAAAYTVSKRALRQIYGLSNAQLVQAAQTWAAAQGS